MDNVITLDHVYKSIGGKPIILDMSLKVPKGTLFGLLGPNGAGKSTCLKLITGRLRPSSGKIGILGNDPWRSRVKIFKQVGYLAQNPTAPVDDRVLNFIVYMVRLRGMSKSQAKIHAREVLAMVGLEKFEGNIVGKLSGGELQRLGFANALIGDPEILILDEPTSSLDPEGRIYIMDLITKMARDQEKTVIVSSHILPEIQRMTNYIAIMSEGRVLITGNMHELTENIIDSEYVIEVDKPELLQTVMLDHGYEVEADGHSLIVFTKKDHNRMFAEIPKICSDNGLKLKSFRPVRDSLENVFLSYVSRNNRRSDG